MNELGEFLAKYLPYIKRRKFRFLFGYILFIVYFSVPSLQIPILEYNTFRISSLMEQRAIENKMLFYPRQSWCGLNNVNPNLLKGIISMEDGKFFTHKRSEERRVGK